MRFQLTRRRVLIGAGVLTVVALVALSLRPTPIQVEIGAAETTALEVAIEEDGRTRAVDRYLVAAPVAGRLRRITLPEGARVEQGQVVAEIEPAPLDPSTRGQLQAQLNAASARLGAAETAVAQAEAAAQQAERELERRRVLVGEGALTQELLEQYALALELRERELEAARDQVRAAAADVEAMRASLLGAGGAAAGSAVAVRAPSAGAVLRVPERSERVVQPGTPLLEIGDPDALEVVVDVLTPDAVRIHPGMPATLTGWGGDTLTATVRRVEPSAFTRVSALGVEEQRVNVVLDVDQRPAALGDGYRVDARIVVWADGGALTVPAAAVFRDPSGGWRAFVVEGGVARLRTVEVGERGDGRTQILSGLEAGEEVVLFPPDDLADGAAVVGAGG